MTAPCKGCPDRDYPHCHMVCEKYLAYKAEREQIRQIKADKARITGFREARFDRMERERLMARKREGK